MINFQLAKKKILPRKWTCFTVYVGQMVSCVQIFVTLSKVMIEKKNKNWKKDQTFLCKHYLRKLARAFNSCRCICQSASKALFWRGGGKDLKWIIKHGEDKHIYLWNGSKNKHSSNGEYTTPMWRKLAAFMHSMAGSNCYGRCIATHACPPFTCIWLILTSWPFERALNRDLRVTDTCGPNF